MKVLFVWPSLDCPPGINHGLTCLSAALKARGHETGLIHVSDALWPVPDPDELYQRIAAHEPDVLAFSATTQQFPWIEKMVRHIRPRIDVPIVVGGVHCTMVPDEAAATGLFDYVCVGEADNALPELVDRLARGADTSDCPNMVVCREGEDGLQMTHNPVGPFPDLTALPPEDFELFDLRHIVSRKDGWMSIITSRGCPFSCSYCFNAEIVKRYRDDGAVAGIQGYLRHQPIPRIIQDIQRLGEAYPEIKTLIFDDDLFTLKKEYVMDFCRAYREAGLVYPFVVNAHIKVFSQELAGALKAAGCRIVKFGLESGSERVRREVLNRRMSNDEMIRAVRLANGADLHSSAFIMCGLPTESRDEVLETLKLCADAQVGRFRWAMFYPYRGTRSYEICKEHGLLDPARLESTGNYFEGTCLAFPKEHLLFLDKLNRIAPWYANAYSGHDCAAMFAGKVTEIEGLSAEAWQARKKNIKAEERALSDELLARGEPHYSIRFSSVMGVHSDYVLKERAEARA